MAYTQQWPQPHINISKSTVNVRNGDDVTEMLPVSASTAAVSATILCDGDLTSIQLCIVQLLNGILHVGWRRELHHAEQISSNTSVIRTPTDHNDSVVSDVGWGCFVTVYVFFPRHYGTVVNDPLTPTVVIWVQLWSILCQTRCLLFADPNIMDILQIKQPKILGRWHVALWC